MFRDCAAEMVIGFAVQQANQCVESPKSILGRSNACRRIHLFSNYKAIHVVRFLPHAELVLSLSSPYIEMVFWPRLCCADALEWNPKLDSVVLEQ